MLGLADQTAYTYLTPFATIKETYQSDADFVARIEASVPANTMVFQMPYIAFLSYANSSHQMLPYSHFRGYLHSHTLRWSFGAMHGRFGDNLHARLAAEPLERSIRELAFLGFGGIFVDRYGYTDGAKDLETKLRNLLGSEPIISRNGRLCFFSMAAFNQRLKGGYTDEEWQEKHDLVYYRSHVRWGPGFYAEETNERDRWRWCGTAGRFEILNPSECPKQISVRFVARTCLSGPATLNITSSAFSETLFIDAAGTMIAKTIEIPPGRLAVHFSCTASPFVEPERALVFGLFNFQLVEIAPAHTTVSAAAR